MREAAAAEIGDLDMPEPPAADDWDDPLLDSARRYRDQIDIYKWFQGKRTARKEPPPKPVKEPGAPNPRAKEYVCESCGASFKAAGQGVRFCSSSCRKKTWRIRTGPAWIKAGIVTPDGKAKYTGLHSLRHFYASWCIKRREDGGLELALKTAQSRLGHSTLAMTADHTAIFSRAGMTARSWRLASTAFWA